MGSTETVLLTNDAGKFLGAIIAMGLPCRAILGGEPMEGFPDGGGPSSRKPIEHVPKVEVKAEVEVKSQKLEKLECQATFF